MWCIPQVGHLGGHGRRRYDVNLEGAAFGADEIADTRPDGESVRAFCIWLSHNGLLATGEARIALNLGFDIADRVCACAGGASLQSSFSSAACL